MAECLLDIEPIDWHEQVEFFSIKNTLSSGNACPKMFVCEYENFNRESYPITLKCCFVNAHKGDCGWVAIPTAVYHGKGQVKCL